MRLFNSSLDGNVRRAIDIYEGEEVNESAFKALVRQAAALDNSAKSKSAGKGKSRGISAPRNSDSNDGRSVYARRQQRKRGGAARILELCGFNSAVRQQIGVGGFGVTSENSERRMAGTTRLELATSAVTGQRSNQLNYVPANCIYWWAVTDLNRGPSRCKRDALTAELTARPTGPS